MNNIKECLINLALDTRDYEWLKEISKKDYNMSPLTKVKKEKVSSGYVYSESELMELAEVYSELDLKDDLW